MEEKLNELNFDEREALIIIANALYKKTGDEFYKNVVANAEELNNREVVSKTENTTWRPKYTDRYYYVIDSALVSISYWNDDSIDEARRGIGNCFRTEEEAKKAVEKLKALKRLKDKGFDFSKEIYWELSEPLDNCREDLRILFNNSEEEE